MQKSRASVTVDVREKGETRGRPAVMSTQERRDRVLDALDAVFARDGMTGLTMSAIAAEAGMSKRTIYALFKERALLFQAHLERVRSAFVHPLGPEDLALPLAKRLEKLLEPQPDIPRSGLPLAVLRHAIAQTEAQPGLAQAGVHCFVLADRALIRAELDRAVERGEVAIADTAAAAVLLQNMVQLPLLDLLLDPTFKPTSEDIRARFRLGLDVFLRGVA